MLKGAWPWPGESPAGRIPIKNFVNLVFLGMLSLAVSSCQTWQLSISPISPISPGAWLVVKLEGVGMEYELYLRSAVKMLK